MRYRNGFVPVIQEGFPGPDLASTPDEILD